MKPDEKKENEILRLMRAILWKYSKSTRFLKYKNPRIKKDRITYDCHIEGNDDCRIEGRDDLNLVYFERIGISRKEFLEEAFRTMMKDLNSMDVSPEELFFEAELEGGPLE